MGAVELTQFTVFEEMFETAPPRRLRAVVADDSADYMEVVCAMLELEEQIDVVGRASNGLDAIEATAHLQPDLLLMDVQMPVMSGLTAASFVFVGFPGTMTILMSAEDSPQLRAACRASGARSFIHKPRFRHEIVRALHSLFGAGFAPEESIFQPQPAEWECD